MEQLQDMKEMWFALNNRVSFLEEENRRLARRIMGKEYQSVTTKLMRKYQVFIVVALVSALLFPTFILFNPLTVEKYRLITSIYWFFFFIACASVDYYLLMNLRNIDVFNCTVSQITKEAAKNWRIHKLFLIFGNPFAVLAIILYALALDADSRMIIGMIFGGLVGLFIGLWQLIGIRRYYRLLQSQSDEQ